MTYRIVIEPTAEREIRSAFHWITENRSPKAAVSWFNSLEKAIISLKTRPQRCPVAAEIDNFPEEIRVLLLGKRQQLYRIIFTIWDDTVHILYVRHAAQDEIEP